MKAIFFVTEHINQGKYNKHRTGEDGLIHKERSEWTGQTRNSLGKGRIGARILGRNDLDRLEWTKSVLLKASPKETSLVLSIEKM